MLYKEMVAQLTKPVELVRAISDKELMLVYMAMGLAGEVGEVVETYNIYEHGNMCREDASAAVVDESGDFLWYLTGLHNVLGTELQLVPDWSPIAHAGEKLQEYTSQLCEVIKKRSLNGKDIDDLTVMVAARNVYLALCSIVFHVQSNIDEVREANETKLRARLGTSYSDGKQAAKGELNG